MSFKEAEEIIKIFEDKGSGQNVINARVDGFLVAGTLYFALKADARSLYGQNVRLLSPSFINKLIKTLTQDKEGVVIVNTIQAMIIAHFSEAKFSNQASRCVEQLGDYLISAGH